MSRLGKKPLSIPSGVTVTESGNKVTVKGSKGQLERTLRPGFDIAITDSEVTITPKNTKPETLVHWGTYASHIKNMMTGVSEEFSKKLIIEGVGFKSQVQGKNLVLDLGFSHQIEMPIPEGLTVTAEKNEVTITGIDKEQVGQFAANVRKLRTPEPYKGKGVRYEDEVVRRKQGKKAA